MRSLLTSIVGTACVTFAFVATSLMGGGRDPGGADLLPPAPGNAHAEERRCSARTLKGAYGIKYDGSTVAGERYASVTLITFDGVGQFVGHDVFSLNGTFIRRTSSGPGAGKLSRQELQAISQKSCSVLDKLGSQIQWIESYVTDDKVHCVYGAPGADLIREHARQGGFPVDRISEVRAVIDPTTAEK